MSSSIYIRMKQIEAREKKLAAEKEKLAAEKAELSNRLLIDTILPIMNKMHNKLKKLFIPHLEISKNNDHIEIASIYLKDSDKYLRVRYNSYGNFYFHEFEYGKNSDNPLDFDHIFCGEKTCFPALMIIDNAIKNGLVDVVKTNITELLKKEFTFE